MAYIIETQSENNKMKLKKELNVFLLPTLEGMNILECCFWVERMNVHPKLRPGYALSITST